MNAVKRQPDTVPLYIIDFYNVRAIYNSAASVSFVATRMLNALTETINTLHTLPKFLIIVLDKDILGNIDLYTKHVDKHISEMTCCFVRQINTIVRRKRVDLLAKKPGAVSGYCTTIIFLRMIRRVGSFHEDSKMYQVNSFRHRFNDCLNDAVAKISQRILTVNSCNAYEHFDRGGRLSPAGCMIFWKELDDLIDRYERNKVKLLPNLKNPPRNHGTQAKHQGEARWNVYNKHHRY